MARLSSCATGLVPCHLLQAHIKNRLFERQGQAVTNFDARLPAIQAALAQESLKDPYLFDFLGLGDEALERDIESALVRHITRFLLELGAGFAFVGRQYRLEVGGEAFFIDLLFYHTRLKCYVVVELKATAFKPEHAGQLNFYLSAVDAQMKSPEDHPSLRRQFAAFTSRSRGSQWLIPRNSKPPKPCGFRGFVWWSRSDSNARPSDS